jgi:hypothetical protein
VLPLQLYEALRLYDDTTQKARTALCDALPLRAIGLEPSNITCSSQSSKVVTSVLRSHSPVTHHTIAFQAIQSSHHTSHPNHTTSDYTMSPLSVPKIFMAGGAVGFGYYLYMRQYWFPNPYKTQGVQNIEDRFSAGGGHPHTYARAGQHARYGQ